MEQIKHSNVQDLSKTECLELLKENSVGHLACRSKGELFIVPIVYVSDDQDIYSHSLAGKKIEMMEEDPQVCFQTEKFSDYFNWSSVIVWGRYTHLHNDEATRAMRKLIKKHLEAAPGRVVPELELEMTALLERAIIYKIDIERITGRREGFR